MIKQDRPQNVRIVRSYSYRNGIIPEVQDEKAMTRIILNLLVFVGIAWGEGLPLTVMVVICG